MLNYYKNHLIWVNLSLVVPLEVKLSFECFWPPLTQSSLPAWLYWEPSDLSGLDPDSPPWTSCSFSLWASYRAVYAYCILCIYCILFTFCCTFWFPMIHSAFDQIFLLTVSTTHDCQLSSLLFDYCSFFWYWICTPGILIPIPKLETTKHLSSMSQ
jgi:hypothetical protein